MSFMKDVSSWLLSGIKGILQETDNDQIEKLVSEIINSRSKKILVMGSGRSGFVGRAFALRLMQIGFNVYVSGETITPALSEGDLIIPISGSGTTKIVVAQAEIAKEIGAKVYSITSQADSHLARISDQVVIVKGRTKMDVEIDYTRRQITGEYDLAPLGTMFELSVMVMLDSIIALLMKRMGKNEIDLKKRHSPTQ